VAPGSRTAGHGLAMTAIYTHTRPETRREQLEAALSPRAVVAAARAWLRRESAQS
jgi:integrase